jgi:hypothetical protein
MSMPLVLLALTLVSKPPHDPCILLKPGEIQALAPKDKLVPGKLDTTAASIGSIACTYEWGSGGNAASGRHYLNVILMDAAKTFPGTPPNLIIQGMLGGSHDPKTVSNPLSGIGEAAMFESKSPINAQASAYAKGSVLQITFESPDARERKDQVIGLLKSAVGRL